MLRASLLIALLLSAAWPPAWRAAAAQETAAQAETPAAPRRGPSGLALPRFVTLRSSEVNLRTGPGVRYPIDWVYQREGLPMQVIDEFEAWRRVRDRDGTEGWVHQAMLSGRRTVVVLGEVQVLREEPRRDAPAVAMLEPGFLASLESCPQDWCEIVAEGPEGSSYHGWLLRQVLWGVMEGEVLE